MRQCAHRERARARARFSPSPPSSVMDTLTQQREALLRSSDKAQSTNSLADRARGLMRLMIVRSRTNVALLVLIIILLIAAIGAVVYIRFIDNNTKKK